nr:hypothetical protein [Sicyoidochytrium minutum DNA virus]
MGKMISSMWTQARAFFSSKMTGNPSVQGIAPRRSWLPGTYVESLIEDNLIDQASTRHGVFVLNLPSGSGKTTIARKCADEAVKRGLFRKTYYIDCRGEKSIYDTMRKTFLKDPTKHMFMQHVLPEMSPEQIERVNNRDDKFGYKVLIVLDHVEGAEDSKYLSSLACSAVNATPYKAFSVLCLTNNSDMAEDFLAKGSGTKVYPVTYGAPDVIRCMLSKSQIRAYAPELTEDQVAIAARAGTFEFCDRISSGEHSKQDLVKQATEICGKWHYTKRFEERAHERYAAAWDDFVKRSDEWAYGENK